MPLSAMVGFTQSLGSGVFGDLNSEQKECIKNILEAGTYMTELINEILEVNCLEEGEIELSIESLSLKNLLKKTLLTLKPLLKKHNIKLINQVQEDIQIEVDRNYFQRIVTHLLSNAIRYNRTDGCIVVSHRLLEEKLYLCIKDTGIGIENDRLRHIFQPSVRHLEQNKTLGTSLNLRDCRRLMGLMSGSINVCSEIKVGSVFYVDFPLSRQHIKHNEDQMTNEFIYFYDDEIHFNMLKNLLLTHKGYQLTGHHYSEDLHAFDFQQPSLFILLDMSKEDALFKLKLLKLLEKTEKSPTLFAIFEGYTEAADIRYILEETLVKNYLTRPFDFNQLLDVFEQ
jgi:hypothetical protein